MFSRAKQGLLAISARSKNASVQEKRVAKNVNSALALTLQDLSVDFRKSQSNYLKSKCNQLLLLTLVLMLKVIAFWLISVHAPVGMKSREERVISGELRPAATVGISQSPFNDNEEEEVEIMMDKGSLQNIHL